jgi:hypothetical protein
MHPSPIGTRQDALRNLNLALARYDRLSSPPQHLLRPRISSYDAVERMWRRCCAAHDVAGAKRAAAMLAAEDERVARLDDWSHGRAFRSETAWGALVDRMYDAAVAAKFFGAITDGEAEFVEARIHDAKRQLRNVVLTTLRLRVEGDVL